MKTHELKLDIKYFDEVKDGNKNFEIRKNDRDFKVGDILELKAWTEDTEKYHTHGKGSYLSRGTIEPAKALFDFGQKPEAGLSDYFMVQNGEDADTIKVKVVYVLSANDVNEGIEFMSGDETAHATINGQVLVLSQVEEVLKKYLNVERIPENYVVLGIEVIR